MSSSDLSGTGLGQVPSELEARRRWTESASVVSGSGEPGGARCRCCWWVVADICCELERGEPGAGPVRVLLGGRRRRTLWPRQAIRRWRLTSDGQVGDRQGRPCSRFCSRIHPYDVREIKIQPTTWTRPPPAPDSDLDYIPPEIRKDQPHPAKPSKSGSRSRPPRPQGPAQPAAHVPSAGDPTPRTPTR
jgi:hypothetical protein